MNGRVAYKIGHSKHSFRPELRFIDDQYDVFDAIEILATISINHEEYRTAKSKVERVEKGLQQLYPKNFYLEKYFDKPVGTFDGLSGITEMFILEEGQTEQELLDWFDRINYIFENSVDKHTEETYDV